MENRNMQAGTPFGFERQADIAEWHFLKVLLLDWGEVVSVIWHSHRMTVFRCRNKHRVLALPTLHVIPNRAVGNG